MISRKDIGNFYTHHVLHSLAIAKFISFIPGNLILDVGTGGGFPGVPLAILFPESEFILLDSIGKKIKVVKEVIHELKLQNCIGIKTRIEDYHKKVDFVISRAVTKFPLFVKWVKKNINEGTQGQKGIICLKGGDIEDEIKELKNTNVVELKTMFSEEYFETKKIIYLPFL